MKGIILATSSGQIKHARGRLQLLDFGLAKVFAAAGAVGLSHRAVTSTYARIMIWHCCYLARSRRSGPATNDGYLAFGACSTRF